MDAKPRTAEEIAQGDESLLREILAFGTQRFEEGIRLGHEHCEKRRLSALQEAAKLVGKDAECFEDCNSHFHNDLCPVVFPDKAILALASKEVVE